MKLKWTALIFALSFVSSLRASAHCGGLLVAGASSHTGLSRLQAQTYRIISNQIEYDIKLLGFDENNEGSALLAVLDLAKDSETFRHARTDDKPLEVYSFNKFVLSKNERQITFRDDTGQSPVELVLQLADRLVNNLQDIKRLSLKAPDPETGIATFSEWTGERGLKVYSNVKPVTFEYSGKDAKSVFDILPPDKDNPNSKRYRGMVAMQANGQYKLLASYWAPAAFFHMQNGLLAMGIGVDVKDHPIILVPRPNREGEMSQTH